MLRKLILGSAAALALIVPSVATSSAQAHDVHFRSHGHVHGSYYNYRPVYVQRHYHNDYRIWYRKSCYSPWQCYATCGCYTDACRYYDYLCGCGYEVRWSY
jgi:hypothetical protein